MDAPESAHDKTEPNSTDLTSCKELQVVKSNSCCSKNSCCNKSSTNLMDKEDTEAYKKSFHRRQLPSCCVSLSSDLGRHYFRESLNAGTMEGYFSISEAYQTQSSPSYCGIASLTVALNALLIDPGQIWKGIWRWFDESMLNCCESLEEMEKKGTTLAAISCLANCYGALPTLRYASDSSIDEFRNTVIKACSSSTLEEVIIISYHRQKLEQSGGGHFSPIGGYNSFEDAVLIMDVARFKYPPHWVKLVNLFEAMQTIDIENGGKSRGYLIIKRKPVGYITPKEVKCCQYKHDRVII